MVGSPCKTSNKTTCTWYITWVGQPFPWWCWLVTTRILAFLGSVIPMNLHLPLLLARGTNQYVSVIYTANKGWVNMLPSPTVLSQRKKSYGERVGSTANHPQKLIECSFLIVGFHPFHHLLRDHRSTPSNRKRLRFSLGSPSQKMSCH